MKEPLDDEDSGEPGRGGHCLRGADGRGAGVTSLSSEGSSGTKGLKALELLTGSVDDQDWACPLVGFSISNLML